MATTVKREVEAAPRERPPVVVRHPLFARMYDRLSRTAEETEQADCRRDLLTGVTGRVIEVGAGNGLNFRYYPGTVDEVVAVEPEAYLRERAEDAARRAPVPSACYGATGWDSALAAGYRPYLLPCSTCRIRGDMRGYAGIWSLVTVRRSARFTGAMTGLTSPSQPGSYLTVAEWRPSCPARSRPFAAASGPASSPR